MHPEDIQRLGLPKAPLAALKEDLQALFIHRWYAAADPDAAAEKATGLIDHLRGRPDLAEIKSNPMLLTALCVRYGEGQRLPQDRNDLYDKIVNNVLFNRYRGENHERVAVRGRLAAIALGMHTGSSILQGTPWSRSQSLGSAAEPSLAREFESARVEIRDVCQVDLHRALMPLSWGVNLASETDSWVEDDTLVLCRSRRRAGHFDHAVGEGTRILRRDEKKSGIKLASGKATN